MDLDILQANPRRRIVFTPKMLGVVAAVIGVCFLMQTVFFYSELRAQRAALEQVQSILKSMPHSRAKTK